MFVLTLAVAAVLAWLRHEVDRAQEEVRAAKELTKLGARVQFFGRSSSRLKRRSSSRLKQSDLVGRFLFAYPAAVEYHGEAIDEVLKHAHAIRRLRQLYLSGTFTTDDNLRQIAALRGLERLNLRSTAVTDRGIEQLTSLPTLEWLSLAHTPVTNQALQPLRRLRRLQHLDITGTFVAEDCSEIEKRMPEGSSVLWGPARSETQRQAAVALESLGASVSLAWEKERGALRCHVRIDGRRHWMGTSSDLEHLAELSPIRSLILEDMTLDDTTVANLASVVQDLESLYVYNVSVDDLQLMRLLGVASTDGPIATRASSPLKRLILQHLTGITDRGLQCLEQFPNLKSLILCGTPVTDAGLIHLSGLARLEQLRLTGTALKGDGLRHLEGLSALKVLRLDATGVGDDALVHLVPLRTLEELSLCVTPVTDRSLEHLKNMTGLRELRLARTAVTPKSLDELREALPATTIHP